MGTAAPVIVAEMADWVALGGGNSGIVGNADHTFGFHVAADELPADDYSRTRDPNGSDGPYVNWDYACAGDFSHKNVEALRALQRNVLARLMRGELQMICEFIGKPWADQPVYYWARWNGDRTLRLYTGAGHDTWSHISWYRSRVDQRAFLWTTSGGDDMQRYQIARDVATKQLYLSSGMQSRPIAETDIQHLKTLAKEGAFELQNDGAIRDGWYPGAYGPVATGGGGVSGPVDLTAAALDQIEARSFKAAQRAEDE